MIVYAESNFVLELALEQEEQAYAENILAAAERGRISLVAPSFSIAEPFSTIAHRSRIRKQINNGISDQARQLERSATHAGLVTEIRAVAGKLASLEGHELMKLQSTVDRVLRVATVVPMTSAVFAAALNYTSGFRLPLPDAIVLASTIRHAATQPLTEPKVFANRNPKDFDVPDVVNLLATQGCELAVTFEDAWKTIAPHCPSP
jgi:predicted nucleic acid-binding protein